MGKTVPAEPMVGIYVFYQHRRLAFNHLAGYPFSKPAPDLRKIQLFGILESIQYQFFIDASKRTKPHSAAVFP
jgi:hypothetical protein